MDFNFLATVQDYFFEEKCRFFTIKHLSLTKMLYHRLDKMPPSP